MPARYSADSSTGSSFVLTSSGFRPRSWARCCRSRRSCSRLRPRRSAMHTGTRGWPQGLECSSASGLISTRPITTRAGPWPAGPRMGAPTWAGAIAGRARSLDDGPPRCGRAGALGKPHNGFPGWLDREPDRAHSASAARASRSLAMRLQASRRWRSPLTGCGAASSTRPSSGRSSLPATSARLWARHMIAKLPHARAHSHAWDGAISLVLKRLADAQRDRDRIHAILGEIDTHVEARSSRRGGRSLRCDQQRYDRLSSAQ